MKTLLVLILSFGAAVAHAGERFQIETRDDDVNFWSRAGRANSRTLGRVGAREKLTVLRTRTLPNGQVWYRVKAERSVLRPSPVEGWVHAKFFKRVRATARTDAGFCASCRDRASSRQANRLSRLTPAAPSAISSSGYQWPVGGVLRSRFGYRRDPFSGLGARHEGIDISQNRGQPVAAAKAGRVTRSNRNCVEGDLACGGRAGNMVVIDHGDGTQTQYMHLSQSCRMPAVGARLARGAILGCVGSTGKSTGAHLHFGVLVNNRFVDPLSVLPRRQ